MKHVLLVSPDISFTGEEKTEFKRDEIHIETVASAEDALERMKTDRFDLLVTELHLSEMNGDELCEQVKSNNNNSYVIIACSGNNHELKRCGRCGADAHVQTPIEAEALLRRISSILKTHVPRATRVLVKVQVNGELHSEPFFSVSHNISVSGMMLEADQTLAKEDTISCSFYLPDSERINIQCRVKRVDKPEGGKHFYGVVFEQLEENDRTLITNYIAAQKEEGNFF